MGTKSKKLGLLIVALFFYCSSIQANQKNKLFIYFDNLRTEEYFLVKHFKELKNEHSRMFDEVEVLNDLAIDKEGELALKNLVGFYSESPATVSLSESCVKMNDDFQKKLASINYLARISIAQKGNTHIEFDFKLYKILPGRSKILSAINQPIHLVEESRLHSNCLLNRTSDHLALRSAIEKLISSDFNPKALIRAKNRPFAPDRTYYFTVGKSVELDGSHSLFPRAKNADVSYKWKLITPDAKVTIQNEAHSVVRLLPEHPETVQIELDISVDGIKMKADTATINFIFSSELKIVEESVPPRASIIQYIKHHHYFKNNKKDAFEVSLVNKVQEKNEMTDSYKIFVQNEKNNIPVRYSKTTTDSSYRLKIEETIGNYIRQPYKIIARYQGIEVVKRYIRYKRFKLVPLRINVGTEHFVTNKVFGVEKEAIDRNSLIVKGSVYLLHLNKPMHNLRKKSKILPQKSALLAESGLIYNLKQFDEEGNKISLSGYKSSLKYQYSYAVLSMHHVFIGQKNIDLVPEIDRDRSKGNYIGFGLGAYIERVGLDIDVLNMYFRVAGKQQLSVSYGFSFNFLFWLANNFGKIRKKRRNANTFDGYEAGEYSFGL